MVCPLKLCHIAKYPLVIFIYFLTGPISFQSGTTSRRTKSSRRKDEYEVSKGFLVPCSRGLSISVDCLLLLLHPPPKQTEQVASCKLQVASCKLQVANSKLQVASPMSASCQLKLQIAINLLASCQHKLASC